MSGRSRNGSALLIVLGMMSFVMVSALAFAAYMRYARLPSSYLRRTSSSRQLAKAAVAEAIEDIDMAIGNNPHPGVGISRFRRHDSQHSHSPQQPFYPGWCSSQAYNTWCHRVFMRAEDPQATAHGMRSVDSLSDTVTPLCLEALAYIPPPLVNEARFFSRWSDAATWRSFDFDLGRYCYCALDVSDYFDINRLSADLPRSSSPASRISLAYLFENGEDHSGPGNGAEKWDQFMNGYRTVDDDFQVVFDGKSPLVSLADFNLAYYGNGGGPEFKSFFCEYVGASGNGLFIPSESTDLEKARRMTFVTDGWFPGERDADNSRDLNDADNQPFPMSSLSTKGGQKPNLSDTLMGQKMNDKADWQAVLGRIGCAMLFDYLDTDHVPLSIAMPVVEKAPMICGVSPKLDGSSLKVKMTPDDEQIEPLGDAERMVKKTVHYTIDTAEFGKGFMGGKVNVLAAFPFSHDKSDTCTVDGRFSLFFSTEPMRLRTENADDVLHLDSANLGNSGLDPDTGVMNVHLGGGMAQPLPNFTNISRQEDAVKMIDSLSLRDGATGFNFGANDLLTVTYTWKQTKATTGGVGANNWVPEFSTVKENPRANKAEIKAETKFNALKANGSPDPAFKADLENNIKDNKGVKVYLNAAVWLLVKSGNDVVDMVPASLFEDYNVNSVPDAKTMYSGPFKRLGMAGPLLRFDTGVEFEFSVNGLDNLEAAPQPIVIAPKTAIVADPRFNYAPESWFSVNGELSENLWLSNNHAADDGRDGDIFMATSDAGYLQSKYELAMLPRFGYGGDTSIGSLDDLSGGTLDKIPNSFNAAANSRHMWQTYDPFDSDEALFQDKSKMPWTSEGDGFKVNPYSDNRNVLMAALANTPLDWARASTNITGGAVDYSSLTAAEFNRKYAWNAYSSENGNRMRWDTLSQFAGIYMTKVRQLALNDSGNAKTEVWEKTWQELDWWGEDGKLCGADLSGAKLWTADRKFLYGYWRDCFAAKQQLFLIFVRAEPTMMGSGSPGQTPPQLGARAVALVWRDPTPTGDDTIPHRTRILFYRQFE